MTMWENDVDTLNVAEFFEQSSRAEARPAWLCHFASVFQST